MEAPFNQFQDRDGLIFRIVDAAMFSERRDYDCGNAHTDTPAVRSHRRNDMIPTPAVFIVSDDDYRTRHPTGWDRCCPGRGRRCDQPLVVEEGATVGRVKEIVA